MMAMRGDALWLSWVFHFIFLFLPLAVLLTIAGRLLFLYSSSIYVFFYFFVFFLSVISYCFLVSMFFNKSRTAAIVGRYILCVIWLFLLVHWIKNLQVWHFSLRVTSYLWVCSHRILRVVQFKQVVIIISVISGVVISILSTLTDSSLCSCVDSFTASCSCLHFWHTSIQWMGIS